jgi:predicted transposase/invertase (TIGR01784 family)
MDDPRNPRKQGMVPGIDPKVDYIFKRLFGSEPNLPLPIHLVNAVLQPPPAERVATLEILNPFNDKEALDDKLSVVDIKARDQSGRQFNVEMQMLPHADFRQRILYYWARLHQQQLHESEKYEQLRPTISICFVNRVLFPKVPAYHLSFQLREPVHQVVFTEDLALHMLELPKFTPPSAEELATPLDAWLYFLRHAERLDNEALPPALRIPEIERAMEVLTMITQSDLERERYEARLKIERDRKSLERYAQTPEGAAEIAALSVKRAEQLAFIQGLGKGIQDGRVIGEQVGRIHSYQELLGLPLTPSEDLLALPIEELKRRAEAFKQQLSR